MAEGEELLILQLSSIKTQPVNSFIGSEPRVKTDKRNDRTKEVIGQEIKRDMIYIKL